MDAAAWNSKYQVGQQVILTLADGERRLTRTRSKAMLVGQFAMIEVEAIERGTVPLSWCWPVKGATRSGAPGE